MLLLNVDENIEDLFSPSGSEEKTLTEDSDVRGR